MAKKVVTNDGKKGGWLVGKRHYDKNGNSLGGIKAVVSDAGNKPVELEGGEVIINREASKKYWKELSKINQSAGNGVAIGPPSGSFDEDPSEEYSTGGKIEFNANHIPNKWILNYAIKIKEDHPEIWKLGGNIFGNEAFVNLKRVAERGHWLDSEEWMYKKWRSYVARHTHDFRIEGVVAMLKWVDKVEKGWQYMKNLIEEKIKKIEARESKKMKDGGSVNNKGYTSYKDKYNKKYGYKNNASHSLEQIHIDSGVSMKGLQQIYDKGIGAYKTNPSSVRPNVTSKEQWAMARVYSSVMGGKAAKVDAKELKMETGGQIKKYPKKYKVTSDFKGVNPKYNFCLLLIDNDNEVHLMGKYSNINTALSQQTYWENNYAYPNQVKKWVVDELIEDKMETGGLIAPNGKSSNLTPEQYKLVRTPEFKSWFGDWENDLKNASKVVDENGEPLVVYRGDSSASKKGNIFKTGFNRMSFINRNRLPNQYFHYFVNNYDVALGYAKNQIEDHNDKVEETGKGKLWNTEVTPYFLNIRNYIDLTPSNHLFPTFEEFKDAYKRQLGEEWYKREEYRMGYDYGFQISRYQLNKIFEKELGKNYLENEERWTPISSWIKENFQVDKQLYDTYGYFIEYKDTYSASDILYRVYNKMLEKNIDGLLFLENTHWKTDFYENWKKYQSGELKYDYKKWTEKPKVYAALESNQIKLADGTNTTFDSNNLDIRFDHGGDVRDFDWYQIFKKQQLKKGTEHELEHKDTIEKFKRKGISDAEVAREIAQDHLDEDENYYIELDKMENKKRLGGKLEKQVLSSEYYGNGGGIDYDSIQPRDKNGVPKIDDKSLEILTERILKLPQTKSFHTDQNGNYTKERKELHKEIINKFKKEAVCITKGRPIAILMGGSPASGKSSFIKKYRPYLMSNDIVKVDADEIRAKLPEYKGFNATQTHLETKDIVNTLISDRNIGVPCDFDLIYDGTMNSVKSYEPLIELLKKQNYKIFIIYIDKVPYETVVSRMKERYKKSGRFVPVEVIDDFFSKGTEALNKLKKEVDGYVVVDGSNFDYNIIERGGEELPQERNHKFLGTLIDQKQLEKIQYKGGGKVDGGDCYMAAGDFVINQRFMPNKIKFVGEPYIVHAEVTGQGAINGLKYGHAWVEDDQLVYDYSNGRELIIPKDFYYAIGKVKKTKPRYFRYTFEQATKKMLDSGHYGPWDLKTESGL